MHLISRSSNQHLKAGAHWRYGVFRASMSSQQDKTVHLILLVETQVKCEEAAGSRRLEIGGSLPERGLIETVKVMTLGESL
jgi:hypothetical protein